MWGKTIQRVYHHFPYFMNSDAPNDKKSVISRYLPLHPNFSDYFHHPSSSSSSSSKLPCLVVVLTRKWRSNKMVSPFKIHEGGSKKTVSLFMSALFIKSQFSWINTLHIDWMLDSHNMLTKKSPSHLNYIPLCGSCWCLCVFMSQVYHAVKTCKTAVVESSTKFSRSSPQALPGKSWWTARCRGGSIVRSPLGTVWLDKSRWCHGAFVTDHMKPGCWLYTHPSEKYDFVSWDD